MKPNLWNVFLGELLTSKSHPEHDKGPQLDTAFCQGHKPKNSLFLLPEVKEDSWGEWTLCHVYDTTVPPLNPPVLFLWQTSAASANFNIFSVYKWSDGGLSETTEPEVFGGKFSSNRVTSQTRAPKQTHETSLWNAATDPLVLWCCVALKSPFATLH